MGRPPRFSLPLLLPPERIRYPPPMRAGSFLLLLPLLPLLAGAGCLPRASSVGTPGADPLPNVIVVLADDLGIGDLGCYNPDSKIPTPHLDRLAREGIRLTDAHSPSGVCTPTRYGLLTGRYAWRSRLKKGVLNGYSPLLIEPGRPTLASLLGGHGYHTAAVGKWHLGLGDRARTDYEEPLTPGPLACGFDTFFGIPASLDMPPYLFVRDRRPERVASTTIEASAHRRQDGGGFWRAGPVAPGFEHADVLPRLTAEAIAYLESRAEEPDPFFLYLPLSAPHTPWMPAEDFRGVSQAGYYGDFVAMVDAAVGEVLGALEGLGLAGNTLVVVTSDNGSHWPVADVEHFGHAANLGYRGQKADIWEGGNRIPFLARWPGHIPAGEVTDELVCLTDLFATLAGIVAPVEPAGNLIGGEDSLDIRSVLEGRGVGRETLVLHSMSGMFALRSGSWKLIEGRGSGGFTAPRKLEPGPGEPTGQLYDLTSDPGEARNLFLEQAERVARLQARLDAIRAASGPGQG